MRHPDTRSVADSLKANRCSASEVLTRRAQARPDGIGMDDQQPDSTPDNGDDHDPDLGPWDDIAWQNLSPQDRLSFVLQEVEAGRFLGVCHHPLDDDVLA